MFNSADVRRVLSQPGADLTLSLYLQVDPSLLENQSGVPGWRIWLKNALRGLETAHDDPALPELIARAQRFAATLRPECKAIAAFFTPRAEQVFQLPVPVPESEASFGRPAVASLLWLLDEYEPYVVARVDSEKVRLFTGQMGRAGLAEARKSDVDEHDFKRKYLGATSFGEGGYTHGGNNRDAFAATIDDHTRRFHREVAEQIGHLLKESGAQRILLGGDDAAAHAIKALMHDSVARAVVAIVPVPPYLADQPAFDHMMPAALAFERSHEQALVDEVVDLARSGGRGALGVPAVLACLANKQVELLLVPWPLRQPGLRASLPELALAAGAAIELVAGPAAERLEHEGGLAARLFYPQAAPPAASA